ncbi:paralemmin-3 [Danio aesculapii]|uniref:paralemmin-3 n=1 Tax=Danio aesculapii TaxID=1142201 RepID=UPI0024C088E0|nr:paralemmin-3 [Danio aesculapii]
MEHEAEKYQQRLQAIAEKRRIQEEQERARREMEDERLRLQQLKRKSLRDQWLMEGPPTSPDSAGPRSPLWGSKAQEIETHINKLQATSEHLAEEEVKLKKLIDGTSAQSGTDEQAHHKDEPVLEYVETVSEMTPNGPIVENGKVEKQDDSVHAVNHEEHEHTDAKTKTDTETSSAVTNGNVEGDHSSVNGFSSHPAEGIGAAGITMTFLGFKEAEPGQGVDEDDDGGAIIRAERVIITDEGEEILEEELTDDKNQDGSTESMALKEETEDEPEKAEDASAEEIVLDAEGEKEQESIDTQVQNVTLDTSADLNEEGEMEKEQESVDTQVQSLSVDTEALQVSVNYTTQPSPVTKPKGETNATESQVSKIEEALASTRISVSQFQEVPLDESNVGTEKQQVEQEPLLTSKTAAQLDTSLPNRAEETGGPKRKTCQCCSIM